MQMHYEPYHNDGLEAIDSQVVAAVDRGDNIPDAGRCCSTRPRLTWRGGSPPAPTMPKPTQVEHTFTALVAERVSGITLSYKSWSITISCGSTAFR